MIPPLRRRSLAPPDQTPQDKEDRMAITMYQVSAPQFVKMLGNLKAILEKAAAHAAAKKIDDTVFVNSRLYPDMLPLSTQVQIASDFARATCARLAGVEPPSIEDKEKTLADLIARVDVAIAYVRTFTAEKLDGSETREVKRKIRGNEMTFTGIDYLLKFALPNFYFHVTTAYAILRHNGVEIGKGDFLGLS
jgi:uncharacterized protein